ncbi:MAG: HAD-IIB family hydrolase, partial [Rhodoferax sp.]|uniref:HAD-IIB family hydrolase n=1 Tax=Rhodoferax sp. TaxID=50421 RepID=UPI00271A3040
MLELADWPLADRRQLIGVFTDIDDTLTTEGAITPDALQALGDLKAAGLHVIPITGRPIGWSEPLARGDATRGLLPWPVDAIVAETGAAAFACQNLYEIGLQPPSLLRKQLSKLYQQDAATRAANYSRMQEVARQVLREVPGAQLSQDSAGRETDIAIDHSEFTHLGPEHIAQAVRIMQSAGMTASVSSIHINGWFGAHNKLVGARWIVRELFGRELDAELNQWAFVGDSPNDQVMFEHFPHSVGVANIQRFEAQLTHQPRYIA